MKKENVFWGLALILTGVFLIISKLGYCADVNVFSLLMTVFLVVIIVKSIFRGSFTGILFPIAFICIIYDEQLGITNITPWTVLLAALLGSIGFSMIFSKPCKWMHKKNNSQDHKFEEIDIEDKRYVTFKTSFASSIKYINSDNFEQADFGCSFGSMKIYFDNVTMKNDVSTVTVNANFSEVELYIPKNWKVDNRITGFLGSVSEKNKTDKVITNTLVLVGYASFSSVDIIYV